MGVTLTVIPFDDQINTPAILEWFKEAWDLEIPPDAKPGRYPTLDELRDVLNAMPYAEVEYHESRTFWRADIKIEERGLSISFSYARKLDDVDIPQHFSVDGDPDLLSIVLSRLTPFCGTQLLMFNGEDPELFL
jgi:hypothetical protein